MEGVSSVLTLMMLLMQDEVFGGMKEACFEESKYKGCTGHSFALSLQTKSISRRSPRRRSGRLKMTL